MKNKNLKISANEINRYLYCPYQWYYSRYYGQRALKEKYKALGSGISHHDQHFEKGKRFHRGYYRLYRLKRLAQLVGVLLVVGMIIWGVYQWIH